ncbi:MAG: hypothetical protein ACRDHY_13320, partial [Anaerolineales bacterium]
AAQLLRRRWNGPPVLVTFLPAFWLLVPGVLSLIGLTKLAGNCSGPPRAERASIHHVPRAVR